MEVKYVKVIKKIEWKNRLFNLILKNLICLYHVSIYYHSLKFELVEEEEILFFKL